MSKVLRLTIRPKGTWEIAVSAIAHLFPMLFNPFLVSTDYWLKCDACSYFITKQNADMTRHKQDEHGHPRRGEVAPSVSHSEVRLMEEEVADIQLAAKMVPQRRFKQSKTVSRSSSSSSLVSSFSATSTPSPLAITPNPTFEIAAPTTPSNLPCVVSDDQFYPLGKATRKRKSRCTQMYNTTRGKRDSSEVPAAPVEPLISQELLPLGSWTPSFTVPWLEQPSYSPSYMPSLPESTNDCWLEHNVQPVPGSLPHDFHFSCPPLYPNCLSEQRQPKEAQAFSEDLSHFGTLPVYFPDLDLSIQTFAPSLPAEPDLDYNAACDPPNSSITDNNSDALWEFNFEPPSALSGPSFPDIGIHLEQNSQVMQLPDPYMPGELTDLAGYYFEHMSSHLDKGC